MSGAEDKSSGADARGVSKPSPVSAAALAPGLHLVATPIGTARDITLRALDTLREADVIAAEDTRTARRLMELHGIPVGGRTVLPYHDHNGAQMRPKILAFLQDGLRVAYVSDAGTPLVADPGFQLACSVIEAGLPLTTAPGPSAALVALIVSGLPSDRFLFAGFPPPAKGARQAWLRDLDDARATVIVFESPKRIYRLLAEMCEILGEDRKAALCRELTKRFEDVRRGRLGDLRDLFSDGAPRGECVLVIDRPGQKKASVDDLEGALREELATKTVKAAVALVAERTGHARRDVYQLALRLKENEDGDI